uniref:5-hydroxytryptamine (serotonin) receptor 3A n=1 Tax=Neolamprologus brichardi TaxID=32507 RepID=A0A3Q4FYP4_NEOBR
VSFLSVFRCTSIDCTKLQLKLKIACFTVVSFVFPTNSSDRATVKVRSLRRMTHSHQLFVYCTHQLLEFWDPVQCGTDMMSLPSSQFWIPDIVINEFMEENKAPPAPYLYLYSNGQVNLAIPVRVVSSCNLNIYTFPFDIQNCIYTFNSYLHDELITQMSQSVMATMGEWELLEITANFTAQTYLTKFSLIVQIKVKRRATMYVVNLLLPSCFLITVDLFSFLLPPQSVDRSAFKMTLILGYTVFLLIMNDLLPVTGNTIPLINVFFSLCLALMVASLLETILITNLLCGSADFSPVPRWMRVLVLQFLGVIFRNLRTAVAAIETYVGLQEPKGQSAEDLAVYELKKLGKDLQAIRLKVDQELNDSQSSEEWMQVGFIIDRLLFGLYILFISVSFITIIIIWVNSYNK